MTSTAKDKPDQVIEGQLVAQGMNQLATELRTQRELALSKPRDEKALFEAALNELRMVPEFAKKAFYVIPYKEYVDGQYVTKNVEGPSVKSSRALSRRWGNCATASRVVNEEAERFQVEGIFVDLETNVIFRRTVSVSKVRIDKNTKLPVPLKADRITMALQAGMSKAERNATLSGLPVYLVEAYFAEAKKIAGGKGSAEPVEKRFEKMFAQFAKLKVPKEKVKAYIENDVDPTGEKTDEEVIGHMIGIFNAINDGERTVADVFGGEEKPKSNPGAGPVGASNLTGEGKK